MLKPWISKDILLKCKNRDLLLKKIYKENDPIVKNVIWIEYKQLRNEINEEKHNSKVLLYILL